MRANVIFHISGILTLFQFGNTCGPSEYRSEGGECCPMCNIGSVVYKDCSGDYSTTCIPCSQGTFMNEPNGLYKCFACTKCSESQGLYIQSKCTTIEDTTCDVLDGYYCREYSNSQQCHLAQKHSVCKPGQETKTQGTKNIDTVCMDCVYGFYSPSGLTCTKWTDCQTNNEIQTEDGSPVKDVKCAPEPRKSSGFYASFIAFVITVLIICCWRCFKKANNGGEYKSPTEETRPAITKPYQTPEENNEDVT